MFAIRCECQVTDIVELVLGLGNICFSDSDVFDPGMHLTPKMELQFISGRNERKSRAICLERCLFDDVLKRKNKSPGIFNKRQLTHIVGRLEYLPC